MVIKQVCTNGLVLFGSSALRFTRGSIPVAYGPPLIAAYWTDLITSGSSRKGRIYYRSTSSGEYSIASCRRCASGCVVECNREVAGSNLGLGYFAPRSTQPSIPPGSVNEYQLRLGRQRPVWLIPIPDERVGVQVKLWNPLRTRAIPEHFCGGDSLRRGAISSVRTLPFITNLLLICRWKNF